MALTRIERDVVQPFQGLNEEPTISAIPGPLPFVNSPGQASPAFQDVDKNLTNAEHEIPESLESQFAHNSHERRPVILDGHVIAPEPSLDPSTNPQSSQLPTKESYKNAIALIRVALQAAVVGLKAAPIRDLDQIPGALLLLIETYEVSYPSIRPGVLSDSIT